MKKIFLPISVLALLCFSCTKNTAVNNSNPNTVVVEKSAPNKLVEKEIISPKEESIASNVSEKKQTKAQLSEIDLKRQKHANFLKNSPFSKTLKLSEDERMEKGIPPNKYYESEWELTMNPETGKPDTQNLIALRDRLIAERNQALASGRAPGDASDNNWIERGPTNVGGRTRGLMFDPNDPTKETVYAGGVSGGLWKNTNISSSSSTWTRVNIPENLSVSTITYDPNNTNVFYVGTGESYVGGDVSGDGVWKSTNGGLTFTKIFGGISGPTTFQSAANVTVNSPGSVAGDYVCYPSTAFGTPVASPITENVILVNDGTGTTASLGCNGLANAGALLGKIALIRRGTCNFVVKVKNAQDAGALGVIMMNNVDGTPVAMGGTDATITIPSAMISKADGDALEAALLANGSLNATLNPSNALSFTGNLVPGKQHINDIKIRNNGGNSEIYVAVGDTYYSAANAATYLGGTDYGLYKSLDGGATWTEVSLPLTSGGFKHCPNDIAIGADNKIWVSTVNSVVFGVGGGNIFSSSDGTTFTLKYNVAGGDRTQIEASATTANKIYVLAELSAGGVTMKKTLNGFGLTTDLSLPVDADSSIPANDFARQQAWYDLMLKIDPTNDETVYAGGIDLFQTFNGGTSWGQISHWTGSFGYQYVHSDQHSMAMANGASNKMVFGNDGGVFFSNNSGTTISARNTGFNVTQFYSIGVAPTSAVSGMTGDNFVAGAQDNGSLYFANAPAGASASTLAQGGDGAFSMFDQGADKYYITNYVYNENINYRLAVSPFTVRTLDNDSNANSGAFIAPMALDSNLDMLYSDYSVTATPAYQVRRYSNIKSGVVNRANLTNALLTNSPSALTVSKYTTTSTTLLVGTRTGKLLKVTNANIGTGTWSDITGPGFIGSISDIEYGLSENEIFVTFHNYNVVSIWYTSNGGTTWQNKEGNFPDIPVKCILQNPLNTNEVIIGTELGVWYTNTFNTASPNWNQSYNGMSNVKITDMDLRNDNTVFVATYGRGIFSGQFTATVLSNDTIAATKGIKMYPNPSNGTLNIAIANFTGKLNIEMFDVNGRKVFSNSSDFAIEKSINLEKFQSGIYIVKLEGDGLLYSEKIILN